MNKLSCLTRTSCVSGKLVLVVAGAMLFYTGCTRTAKRAPETRLEPSKISVVANSGGRIVLTTSTAEFQILPSGYLQVSLFKGGQKLSLDDPRESSPAESDYLVQEAKEVHFILDFGATRISEAAGKLGRGKRVEIPAQPLGPSGTGLRRTLRIEVYDDFPNLLLSSVAYTNAGTSEYHIERIIEQQHRFNSRGVKEHPYDRWSYQGASYDWGKDDVANLTRG